MSQNTKLLSYLANDKSKTGTLTARSAASRFGVKNLGARIFDLRTLGFTIYTTEKTVAGKRTFTYRMHPSDRKDAKAYAQAA